MTVQFGVDNSGLYIAYGSYADALNEIHSRLPCANQLHTVFVMVPPDHELNFVVKVPVSRDIEIMTRQHQDPLSDVQKVKHSESF